MRIAVRAEGTPMDRGGSRMYDEHRVRIIAHEIESYLGESKAI